MQMTWLDDKTYVVLKFHYGKRGSVNHIISKTMGRVAVISHAYEGPMPQAGSFWVCRIEKEFGHDKPNGCFVVVPVKVVEIERIMKLVPGTYDTEYYEKTVVCRPRLQDCYCIMPFSLKKSFIKKEKAQVLYQSIVVPISLTSPL